MKNIMNDISMKLALNPRIAFLVDGIGALFSALLLVSLLAPFEYIFGMPRKLVYWLSVPAFVFTLYSLGCYFLNIKNWKPYLRCIAIANLLYCLVTLSILVQQYRSLTVLGIAYFLGEIGIILILVRIELLTIKKSRLK